MARKRKPESLLSIALAPFGGALVSTRSIMDIKILAGSTSPVFVHPVYWTWNKGTPLLFVGTESETNCAAGNCRGWLKVITPRGFGWVSPSASTQLELFSAPPESQVPDTNNNSI